MLRDFCITLKYSCLILAGICFQQSNLYAQDEAPTPKTIKGLDFGVLPSFVYNPDKGLQYGMLANFYYYGKKSAYPNYLFNLYLQSSRTTKKGYVNYLFFDSRNMLPKGLRLTVDMSMVKRGFQQFYGFNGYNSLYNGEFVNPASPSFISRNYYYFEEISKIVSVDIHGHLPVPHFYWDLGLGFYHVSTYPFKNYRRGAPNRPTLFEKYIQEGIIPQNQKHGGFTTYAKASLIYDTRNDEAIPTKGFWIEAIYTNAAPFLNNKFPYSLFTFKFHHYISLTSKLVLAYRLAYQAKLSGNIPFYMLPNLMGSYRAQEALGGSKTIRGIVNRRLVGNGFVLSNLEFRYMPFSAVVLERNLNIGFNFFEDMGIITDKYKIDQTLNGSAFDYKPGMEAMHYGVGTGVRFIVDHNFIVALDYGTALDKRDGKNGFYLDLDYLF